jgi:hypothetical protein
MKFLKRHTAGLFLLVLLAAPRSSAQNPQTSVSVDANANRHPINPNIYGIAYGDAHDMQALNAPLNRWGGNSTTRYNWQIDAHSAAADWYFETYSDGSGTPAGSADQYVATTRSANNGAQPLFTIPMIDYLANLGPGRSTLAGFSVKKYGPQTATDPWNSDAGNGVSSATNQNITGNNPLDTGVANSSAIQQSWVQHFVNTFGLSTTSTGIRYYILDNEPSLWYSTHRDVHPTPPNYQEIYNKIVAYASAIRSADPGARILGFEEWSWWAMYFSGFDQANGSSAATSDYNTHNHTYYYPWLLQQLYAYKQQTGTQLIDVLTVHCYNASPAGNDDSSTGQQTRNRETRILWDPTFKDPSWYGDIGINGRVLNWIPTLKAMVSQYHPGLQIGCTEYNWGDEANLNGATTQADVLGIYGREGFDLATRWTVAKNTGTTPTTYYVTYLASQIYRNYDGSNSTFGDTSVSAATANPDNLSAFAATRSSDGALTVMVINKQQGSTPVTLNLANFVAGAAAQAWQINSASQTSISHLANVAVVNNAINVTVPSQSITLFVIPAGTIAAPTNGTVTPSSGNGSNQVFTATYSDTNGYQDISYALFMAGANSSGSGACFAMWVPAGNTFYLGNDAGTNWLGPAVGGSATTLQNSQCALHAATSSGSGTGNTLTVHFSLSFMGSFAGTKNTYEMVVGSGGSSGWQQEGTWTPGTAQPPTNTSVAPASGSGASQVFTAGYADAQGYQDISYALFMVGANSSGSGACFAMWVPAGNTFYLGNDAGTNWLGPVAGGGTATLQNSQCTLNAATSSGSGTGSTLTVHFGLSFTGSFLGSKNTYEMVVGSAGGTGWQQEGTWTPGTAQPPADISVTPSSGTGLSQVFTATYSDAQGYQDISYALFMAGADASGVNGCFVMWASAANTLYLGTDAGTNWLGPIQVGSSATLQNSQCTLSGAASSAAGSGNTLTVGFGLSFANGFTGTKNTYLLSYGSGGNTGWKLAGTWTP